MSHAMILALAMLMDAMLGEPRWLWSRVPHPAVLAGRTIDWLDRHLNASPNRRQKGVLALAALCLMAVGLGWALSLLGPVVEIILAAILLAQRALVDHVRAVADGLRQSLDQGRNMVGRIVSRDCTDMTPAQVARAAIESAAENLSDGVVAPAFWFLIGGLPGIMLYKAVNTADSMIGYRNDRYEQFGWAAARLDDVMNWVPARLTGLMIATLSRQSAQWPDITRDARAHRSPNAGWPEAAMARALNLALAGPRSYDGQIRPLAWINETARRNIGSAEIEAAATMLWRVWIFAFLLVVAVACLQALPVV